MLDVMGSEFAVITTNGDLDITVRSFTAEEGLSQLFAIEIVATSAHPDLDLGAITDAPVTFRANQRHPFELVRHWSGICIEAERTRCVPAELGQSSYRFMLRPLLWQLSQRRNYRVYRHLTIPQMVTKLLDEWKVPYEARLSEGDYATFDYRVQYGESDLDYVTRLLEEAGVTYFFRTTESGQSILVLSERPHSIAASAALPYEHNPSEVKQGAFHELLLKHQVRSRTFTLRDFDFRRPGYALVSGAPASPALGAPANAQPVAKTSTKPSVPGQPTQTSGPMLAPLRMATAPPAPELKRYEQYHYAPGSFAIESPTNGGHTPVADAESAVRHEATHGERAAQRMLEAEVVRGRRLRFQGTALPIAPGEVFTVDRYPSGELDDAPLLLASSITEGNEVGTWSVASAAYFTDVPYRPARTQNKPTIPGTQSAVVVGPPGEEIHTDEYGRVKIQFPWDREASGDDDASCWVRVDYASAGIGYGQAIIPHVGQEVMVAFLHGDPDCPVVVARVFNQTCPPPHQLPENKYNSAWKSIPRNPPQMPADIGSAQGAPPAGGPQPSPTATEVNAVNTPLGQQLFINAVNNGTLNCGNTWTESIAFARTTSVGFFDSRRVGFHGHYQWGMNRETNIGQDDITQIERDRTTATLQNDTTSVGMVHRVAISNEVAVTTFKEMAEKIIVISTTDATVTLDGPNVSVDATGDISLTAGGNIGIRAAGLVNIEGEGNVEVKGPVIKLN